MLSRRSEVAPTELGLGSQLVQVPSGTRGTVARRLERVDFHATVTCRGALVAMVWLSTVFLAAPAWAREPGFVGAESCKLCHRDIYQSWRRTPHSSTGTVDIDGEPRCNDCHTTDVGQRLRGVQCEACHGPGEFYSPAEVMIDPEKASMAGLIWPTEDDCRRCHDHDEPNHRREFAMPSGSDWANFVHLRDQP